MPPSVKAGRTTAGSCTPSSSASDETTTLSGTGSPAARIVSRKCEPVLGAADRVDVGTDQLDAEADEHAGVGELDREVQRGLPAEGRSSASGRSRSITCAIVSTSSGSRYVASAHSGSVMIVAGLELTSTTR